MNTFILNRDFQHPADGWYHIENKSDHPDKRNGVVQVIDDTACASIVNRFNAEAAKPGFPGMLIDHEHFKHQPDKETTAYGWLMQLQNRSDGIYGKVRWTGTGQRAVDDGDYRFFSTEYEGKDLEVLNAGRPKRIRPMALSGLTLTNDNHNKGQKPITNRMNENEDIESANGGNAIMASGAAYEASEAADSPAQHEAAAVAHRKAAKAQKEAGHPTTSAYHSEMAEAHDKTAASLRNGAAAPVENRGQPGATETGPSNEEENRLAATMLILDFQRTHGMTYDAARNRARAAAPHLFGISNRQIGPTAGQKHFDRIVEEAADREVIPGSRSVPAGVSHEFHVKVQEYRVSNRCTFAQAWNAVRVKNPDLFWVKTPESAPAAQPAPRPRYCPYR